MKSKIKSIFESVNLSVLSFLFMLPGSSHATTIQSVIDKSVTYLQGGLAKSIGVGAIVISGYLCIAKQKFPKEYFMMILVGLGLIFGASSLYSTMAG